MGRRGSFLIMAAATTLGFALVAWVSGAGSLEMLHAPTPTATTSLQPRPTPRPEHLQQPTFKVDQRPKVSPGPDLTWVDDLLSVLLLPLALVVVVLIARWAWRNRWHHLRRPPEVPFDVLPELSLTLAKDAPVQLATLQEGSPRNAIVACWLRLEKVAAEAGVPSDPSETSTEFTTRVLGALAFDPAMINGFAGLYREARFSRHELGEPARRAAVAALRSLYGDIAGSGLHVSPDLINEEAR
jgi:hypothetical protein